MLEIIQFMFSGFWIWLGSMIMLSILVSPFFAIIGIMGKKHGTEDLRVELMSEINKWKAINSDYVKKKAELDELMKNM